MQVTALEIRHHEVEKRPLLGLDLWSKDALANYVRVRWPTNTAKQAAREWTLTLDEAKGVVSARASQATIDKILKHRNGGWKVALPVLEAVIGRELRGFLIEEQGRLEHARRQFEAQEQELAEMAARARALGNLFLRGLPEPPIRAGGQGAQLSGPLGAEADREALSATTDRHV